MNKPAYTHTVRPKGSTAKPEQVTAEGLADLTNAFGERTLKTKYEVVPLAEKPADLPTVIEKAPKTEDKK